MVLTMRTVIPHSYLKFILVIALIAIFPSCNDKKQASSANKATEKLNIRTVKKAELVTPFGAKLDTTLAIILKDQIRGLSGVQPENFKDNEAMLFFYIRDELHHFWMPDTYFDLDLFYLDKDFRVIGIERDLKHYPARQPDHKIPRAQPFFCRHVLEMKASSPISNKIRMGMNLKWTSEPFPQQIESSIRRGQ